MTSIVIVSGLSRHLKSYQKNISYGQAEEQPTAGFLKLVSRGGRCGTMFTKGFSMTKRKGMTLKPLSFKAIFVARVIGAFSVLCQPLEI